MKKSVPPLLAGVMAAWSLMSCATFDKPGFYSPPKIAGAGFPALELKVGVKPFIVGPGGELSGKEITEVYAAGKTTPETDRLTGAFLRDLKNTGLFARVEMAGASDDLVIEGEISKLSQDRTWAGFYVGPLLPVYYMMSLYAIPTDCAKAEAILVVRAREVSSARIVGQWRGSASESGCAGLYYSDWPLNEALAGAAGQVLAKIMSDGPDLVGKVAQLRTDRPVEHKSPQHSGRREILAVFDVQDAGGRLSARTLEQMTDYLAVKMTDIAGYRVVPRDQLRKRLRSEKAAGYKKCFDESCQIELGRAVSAQKSLATKMLQLGSKCAITATLYDLKSETTVQAASVDSDCSEDSLMGGIEEIARKLAGR